MRSIKSTGGRAEVSLRRTVWREGGRYRVHDKTLPGTPDLTFRRAKVAVFVDSRFWHGYLREEQYLGLAPYWQTKLRRNYARDQETTTRLEGLGWQVLRYFEEDVDARCPEIAAEIRYAVLLRSPQKK